MSEVQGHAPAGRRRRRRLAVWFVVVLIVGGGLGWAAVNRPWVPKPVLVAVELVSPGPASRVLAVNGRVTPAREVEINSTVTGRVSTVMVDEGDSVNQNTPLLSIDDTQQRAAVAQAQAQVEAAGARLAQAKMDYERAQGLENSISQKSLDDARLAVETAQKEVDRLASLLEQGRDLLEQHTVRAPFPGTILTRSADPGQVVNSSTPLFLFAELTSLHGEASVDELYASEVKRGLVVKARPAGHTGIIDGKVVYVSPRVDASTGGRLVRVSLPGAADLALPVGLTVTLNIVVEEQSEAITLPRGALIAGEVPAVYVIVDGKAVRRPVQYIDWPSERLIATSGLEAGDVLVAESKAVAREGALVAPKE
ncbi:MAG: efflux RND transporter periplasmic adaptor subunit [Devosia sp.]